MTALATTASAAAASPRFVRAAAARRTAERPPYLRPVPPAPPATGFAAELARLGTTVNYPREKTIVEEGGAANYVFKVASGCLRSVRLLPDGRRCIMSFLLPGDFFGLSDAGSPSQSVETLTDVTLVRYPLTAFAALLDRDPGAARHFFHLICSELSAAQERLLLVGRKTALERLAAFLVGLAERQPTKPGADELVIKLPMSRSDVADYLGLTVETVSRLLATLRSRHIIDVPVATEIVVLDRQRLEATAECESRP